jgi:hypothetical protein
MYTIIYMKTHINSTSFISWTEARLVWFSVEQPRTSDAFPLDGDRTETPLRNQHLSGYDPKAEAEDRAEELSQANALVDGNDTPNYAKLLRAKRTVLYYYTNKEKVSDRDVKELKELVKDALGWTGDRRALPITLDIKWNKDESVVHIDVLDTKTDRKLAFLDLTIDENQLQVFETLPQADLVALDKHIGTMVKYTTTASDDDVNALKETIKDVLGWKGDMRKTPLLLRVTHNSIASEWTIDVDHKTTRGYITTLTLKRNIDSKQFTAGSISKQGNPSK